MIQVIYKDKSILPLIKKRTQIRNLLKRNRKLSFDCKIIFDNSNEIPIVVLIINILVNENYTKESRKYRK